MTYMTYMAYITYWTYQFHCYCSRYRHIRRSKLDIAK